MPCPSTLHPTALPWQALHTPGTRPQLPKESPRAGSTLPTCLTAQPRPRPALVTRHSSGLHGVSLIVRCMCHAETANYTQWMGSLLLGAYSPSFYFMAPPPRIIHLTCHQRNQGHLLHSGMQSLPRSWCMKYCAPSVCPESGCASDKRCLEEHVMGGRSCLGIALSTRLLLSFSLTPSPWTQQPFYHLLHWHRIRWKPGFYGV